jgi:excinuclease ABC subunit C
VLGQPGRQRYCYICLGRAPAPYAYVSRSPTGKDLGVYGPFTSAARAGGAVRRLNDWYRLRDCPQSVAMHFADQRDLFPQERSPGCLRFEIQTCAGPCAGTCTRGQYGAQVRAARRFLDGTDDKPLRELAETMQQASAAMEFERAAAVRDRLTDLEWLHEKLNWLRTARRENTFVYPLAGADGRTVWYLIHRGRVLGACFQPACPASAAAAVDLLTDVYANDPGPGVTPGQVDHVLLVSAWFRKFPAERERLMTPAQAAQFPVESPTHAPARPARKRGG